MMRQLPFQIHQTLPPSRQVAYEATAWYIQDENVHDQDSLETESSFACSSSSSSQSLFAPVTIYNDWPETVVNQAIFTYLLSERTDNFSNFVKDWYQSSCAIVYDPDEGDPQIIGSGFRYNNQDIFTARHVVDGIPSQNLYVRFFRYIVERNNTYSPNDLLIKEYHLDIPITNVYWLRNGLDMVSLQIAQLQDLTLLNSYSKFLELDIEANPMYGQYAMFYFAGGRHQISVGNVLFDSGEHQKVWGGIKRSLHQQFAS